MHDALDLLKTDQTNLQNLAERLNRTRNGLKWVCNEIADTAIRGLMEIHLLREEGEETQ